MLIFLRVCLLVLFLVVFGLFSPSCSALPETSSSNRHVPVYEYRVINAYPHDPKAFTQGLAFEAGFLYEGTGLYGQSTLRKVELATGKVLQVRELTPQFFGEGVSVYQDRIIQLTWQSRLGFVYDKHSFNLLQTFGYAREGWGITHDGKRLILSDGTARLYFLDPETFAEISQIEVRDAGDAVDGLNELEYVKGEIYANVWPTDDIVMISPETGKVTGRIKLAGLLTSEEKSQPVNVLNGVAYDARGGRLFVTGKFWPKVFEIILTRTE